MKFSCEKAILKAAIDIAKQATAKRSTIQSLNGLLLRAGDGLTVCGYDLSIGISTTVEADVTAPGEIVVESDMFSNIVSRLPDDVAVFSCKGMNINLRCGDAEFNFIGISTADYPALPDIKTEYQVSLQQRDLVDLIDGTVFATAKDGARPVLTGAKLEVEGGKATMVALDNFRLALCRVPCETAAEDMFSCVIPGTALNNVRSFCKGGDEPVTMAMGGRHIMFNAGPTLLICRRLEGEFFDYRSIHRKPTSTIFVEKKKLVECIDRAAVVISEKFKAALRFNFEGDKVTVSAKTTAGVSRDVCPLTGDCVGLEIGYNHRYVLDALRHTPDDTVKIEMSGAQAPAFIVPAEGEEKYMHMVLPVRLKAE